MMTITVDKLSIKLCRENPNDIFVFGDNLIGEGKGGQAIIRDEPNAFGIPTKRLPSMRPNAFFGDRRDEASSLFALLNILAELKNTNGNGRIVFPSAGLGTGLAKMEEKSPKLYKAMNEFIKENFGVEFKP